MPTTTPDPESVSIAALTTAIAARKSTLAALRERIARILQPIPYGVTLCDGLGPVCDVQRICTGASQWSNRRWEVTIRGTGYITPGGYMLAADIEDNYWDGHNRHHRTDEPYLLGSHEEEGEPPLRWARGKVTRELAARLPAAVAAYIADCRSEAVANESTLSE